MGKIVINGAFYTQKSTGVHRFARELMNELDKIVMKDMVTIVVPEYTNNVPEFKNINVEKYGRGKALIWEQIYLVRYLIKCKAICISLCNTLPLLKPGIICIHDAAYKVHPEYFTTLHGKLSCIWHKIHYRIAAIKAKEILTVSYFSKYQIIDAYKINPSRITVIGNGWQHMNVIVEDDNLINKNNLEKGKFFFTLGNISKNKNTKWVYEVAKKHPQYQFVISGRKAEVSNEEYENLDNIINLGYITDGEIKSLLKNCRAFIFPSIHEGFGIPPMEALSQNSKIIISNSTCLPEIYGDAAYYIDPYNADINIDEILKESVSSPEKVLNKYSWEKSASNLLNIIRKYAE